MVLSLYCLPDAKSGGEAGWSNIRVVLEGLLHSIARPRPMSASGQSRPKLAIRPFGSVGCRRFDPVAAYHRRVALSQRTRHLVTCRSQRDMHLLSLVPPAGLAHLPTQFAA